MILNVSAAVIIGITVLSLFSWLDGFTVSSGISTLSFLFVCITALIMAVLGVSLFVQYSDAMIKERRKEREFLERQININSQFQEFFLELARKRQDIKEIEYETTDAI